MLSLHCILCYILSLICDNNYLFTSYHDNEMFLLCTIHYKDFLLGYLFQEYCYSIKFIMSTENVFPSGAGSPTAPKNTAHFPLRDYATQKRWPWNKEGGGEDKDRVQRRLEQQPGRPGPAGQGRTERSRKYASVRRERIGTSTVVQGKGEVVY